MRPAPRSCSAIAARAGPTGEILDRDHGRVQREVQRTQQRGCALGGRLSGKIHACTIGRIARQLEVRGRAAREPKQSAAQGLLRPPLRPRRLPSGPFALCAEGYNPRLAGLSPARGTAESSCRTNGSRRSRASPSASAGIPATGCSSPAPSSPSPPRSRATISRPSRISRPRSVRPPARSRASRASRSTSLRHDVRTPADQPDVLVALNPAALRANIRDVRPSGMVIVNSDAFNAKSLKLAGYDHDPLPELRGRFQLVEIPLTAPEPRGAGGSRDLAARRRSLEELLRARPHVLALQPPDGLDPALARGALQGRGARGERARAEGGPRVRRDDGAAARLLRRPAREDRARRLPQHHGQHGARVGHRRGGACS